MYFKKCSAAKRQLETTNVKNSEVPQLAFSPDDLLNSLLIIIINHLKIISQHY